MKNPNSIRRLLVTAAALVALSALTVGATACTSTTNSTTPVTPARTAAPAPTPAPGPAAAQAVTSAHVAAAAAPVPTTAGPSAADGKTVVESSCIGRCHQSGLLGQRYPKAKAKAIAADMGSSVGLSSAQKAAVVAYFAQ